MAKAYSYSVETFEDISIESMLEQIDYLNRSTVIARALRRAANIVKENAIPRISRSEQTKTAEKKSAKQKQSDKWRKPLADSIDIVLRTYKDGLVFVALTGPKRESGQRGTTAHAHLLEKGHRAYFWSKQPSTRKTFVEGKRWLAPAIDTTMAHQQDVVLGTLLSAIKSANRKRNKRTILKRA